MTDALFTAAQLSNSVHETIDSDTAAVAEQIVWGWLSDALRLSVRPDPVPADLFAWALELGGIAWRNGLKRKQVGQIGASYDDDARREQILESVSRAGDVGTQQGGPQGSFPPAQCWPDPIRVVPTYPFGNRLGIDQL